MFLAYPQRKFALADLPSMAEHAETNEPKARARQFVRVYRRLVDPTASVDQPMIDALSSDIDRMTATALYCDQLGLPGDFLQNAAALTEREDPYSLPHAMMATGWAIENGCLTIAATKDLHERQVQLVETRLARRDAGAIGDAPIEAVLFLYYTGERSHVKDEWVDAVLDAQLPSGGWAANGSALTDDHTTTLALWLLLEAAHPEVPQVSWIPKR